MPRKETKQQVINDTHRRLQEGRPIAHIHDEKRYRWLARGCFDLLYDWTEKRTIASLEVLTEKYLLRDTSSRSRNRPYWKNDRDEEGDIIPPSPNPISGYERGHLAAFANHNITRKNALKTCIKTNSFLQIKGDKSYRELEQWVRKYAEECEDIVIITYISNTIKFATDYSGTVIEIPDHTIKILKCRYPESYPNISCVWYPFYFPNDLSMQKFPQNSGQFLTSWNNTTFSEFSIETDDIVMVHPLRIIKETDWNDVLDQILNEVNDFLGSNVSILFQPCPKVSIDTRLHLKFQDLKLKMPDKSLLPSKGIRCTQTFLYYKPETEADRTAKRKTKVKKRARWANRK